MLHMGKVCEKEERKWEMQKERGKRKLSKIRLE